MNKKEVVKIIKDSMITGICTAVCGIVVSKLCTSTDEMTERMIDKFINYNNNDRTLEEVFAED